MTAPPAQADNVVIKANALGINCYRINLQEKRIMMTRASLSLKLFVIAGILTIFAAPTQAEIIVGLTPSVSGAGTGDQNFSLNSFLTLPGTSTTATGTVNVVADAGAGTPDFSFDFTVSSLTSENLIFDANNSGTNEFISAGGPSELINAVGEGLRLEVSNVTNGVVFDGFESIQVSQNGGNNNPDTVTITSGLNILVTDDNNNDFALGDFVSGTEIELTVAGGGVRLGNADLNFSVGTVPEPSSLAVLAMGLVGCVVRRRKS